MAAPLIGRSRASWFRYRTSMRTTLVKEQF